MRFRAWITFSPQFNQPRGPEIWKRVCRQQTHIIDSDCLGLTILAVSDTVTQDLITVSAFLDKQTFNSNV